MSELFDKQVQFARDVPLLINKAFELGYLATLGEVERSPEQAARNAAAGIGILHSLHTLCLAIDLKLFKPTEVNRIAPNGGTEWANIYLTDTADYEALGVFWESISREHCWGGRFSKPDGDHFSITYQGVK